MLKIKKHFQIVVVKEHKELVSKPINDLCSFSDFRNYGSIAIIEGYVDEIHYYEFIQILKDLPFDILLTI